MDLSTAKSVGVFIIIIACFTVLYPKIFHPLVLNMLGYKSVQKENEDMLNRIPPHLRKPMSQNMHSQDDFGHQRLRPSHPGLRAAAEMKKQTAQPSGIGGKGLMSVVLPLYAVGIVVYLIYTLTKVFGKNQDPTVGADYLSEHNPFSNTHHEVEKNAVGTPPKKDNYEYGKNKNEDFERLLLRADERKITEDELQILKERLIETETQMSRILQAMNHVHTNIETLGEAVINKDQINEDEKFSSGSFVQNLHELKTQDLQDMKSTADIASNCEDMINRIDTLGKIYDVSKDDKTETINHNEEIENISERIFEKDSDVKNDNIVNEQLIDVDIDLNNKNDSRSTEISSNIESNIEFQNNIILNDCSNDLRQRKKHIAAI